MSNSNQMLVIEFDGNDYDYWCIKMLTFLIGKDLWEIVESGYEEPADWNVLTANERTTIKEARKKNAQALFHIEIALDKSLFPRMSRAKTAKVARETLQEAYQGYEEPADWNALIANERTTIKEARKKNTQALFHIEIALDKSLFPRISGAKIAKAAWENLQKSYQGSDQVNVVKLQTLKRDFENLKMQEAECVSDYCVRVKGVVNKMATLGETPTNVSITSGLTPLNSPSSISSTSSSSPTSSPSSTRKVRRLSDIYERSANQAHEESPIGDIANFSLLAKTEFEPSCFEDACTNEVWMQAMQEEMDSIQMNYTWMLTELPHDKKKIDTKWVYKTKFNSDGSV
eukprot:PITA_26479